MLNTLSAADFRPYLNQLFHLHAVAVDGQPTAAPSLPGPLALIEVTELGTVDAGRQPDARHPFSLIFQAADGRYMPQRIYTLAHDGVGQLDLFLVPLGPTAGHMRYQAVFN